MSESKKNDETTAPPPAEGGPSRRDFLVQGSKTAAGVGIAALLGNLGHWALSYAADKEPIKVGVLHSLSGTMAISEVSLRDVVLMAVDEINAKGGIMRGPSSAKGPWIRSSPMNGCEKFIWAVRKFMGSRERRVTGKR